MESRLKNLVISLLLGARVYSYYQSKYRSRELKSTLRIQDRLVSMICIDVIEMVAL